ncbi:MAG: Lrp/AsnC family transcriptional regulator [Candidatus Micrarchaeota archaeon]|nr:Lrp/AsnC family transcriptional regulator [Candidatus Micrarchaeota archaeon]
MKQLDKIDRKILAAIETDARMPVSRIAKKARISRTVAEYRLKKSEETGIIRGYYCLLDPSKFGLTVWKLWLSIKMGNDKEREGFYGFVSEHPRVWWYSECAGAYDVVICVLCRNPHEFYDFFTHLQGKWGKIIRDSVTLINVSFEYHTRGYLLENRSKLIGTSFQKRPRLQKMTETEMEILRLLSKNSRIGYAKLSQKTGKNVKTIRRAIENLKHAGIIVYFRPSIDVSKFGYEYYKVLLHLQNATVDVQNSILHWCRRHPNIMAVISCVGPWQFELEVETDSFKNLVAMLTELKDTFPETVRRYETLIITREGNYELDLIERVSKIG